MPDFILAGERVTEKRTEGRDTEWTDRLWQAAGTSSNLTSDLSLAPAAAVLCTSSSFSRDTRHVSVSICVSLVAVPEPNDANA